MVERDGRAKGQEVGWRQRVEAWHQLVDARAEGFEPSYRNLRFTEFAHSLDRSPPPYGRRIDRSACAGMTRAGLEPATYGLKVRCSTS